jgi:hypothetical protein
MTDLRQGSVVSAVAGVLATAGALLGGCIERPVVGIPPQTQGTFAVRLNDDTAAQVDLLLVVDNSNSMAANQANIAAQFRHLLDGLTRPPDTDNDGRPDYPPVSDLHVAVVSTDLGTAGVNTDACPEPDGDDAVFNPIEFGAALGHHHPWDSPPENPPSGYVTAPPPPNFRPADCDHTGYFGDRSFITFRAGDDPERFTHDFQCSAALYVNGCGFEQPLEAAYRALTDHSRPGRPPPGFLRDGAVLAIVVLTDEEDGSVRDCRFEEPGVPCTSATDVYRASGGAWADNHALNNRFYGYAPGAPLDPTWPLERYVDPRNLRRGFLGLKPDRPERIVFAAITGVPRDLPRRAGDPTSTDWDALLGPAAPGAPDDFVHRDAAHAWDVPNAPGGHLSMRYDTQSPCAARPLVPACRRGTMPACGTVGESAAMPSRRVVEIARRFDESALCAGEPCRNGLVTSICSDDYSAAIESLVRLIQRRLPGRCVPRPLAIADDTTAGGRTVPCVVREVLPPGATCDLAAGRVVAHNDRGEPVFEHDAAGDHAVCELPQIPLDANGQPLASGAGRAGWYYDTGPQADRCPQRITFTRETRLTNGADTRLECIESVHGGS